MENMNNEIIETTEIETTDVDYVDVNYDELGECSGSLGKVVIGGLVLLGAGAVALAVKNKEKIKDWNTKRKIAKLEKQGYIVVTAEEVAAAEQEIEGEEVIESETTEE